MSFHWQAQEKEREKRRKKKRKKRRREKKNSSQSSQWAAAANGGRFGLCRIDRSAELPVSCVCWLVLCIDTEPTVLYVFLCITVIVKLTLVVRASRLVSTFMLVSLSLSQERAIKLYLHSSATFHKLHSSAFATTFVTRRCGYDLILILRITFLPVLSLLPLNGT